MLGSCNRPWVDEIEGSEMFRLWSMTRRWSVPVRAANALPGLPNAYFFAAFFIYLWYAAPLTIQLSLEDLNMALLQLGGN